MFSVIRIQKIKQIIILIDQVCTRIRVNPLSHCSLFVRCAVHLLQNIPHFLEKLLNI